MSDKLQPFSVMPCIRMKNYMVCRDFSMKFLFWTFCSVWRVLKVLIKVVHQKWVLRMQGWKLIFNRRENRVEQVFFPWPHFNLAIGNQYRICSFVVGWPKPKGWTVAEPRLIGRPARSRPGRCCQKSIGTPLNSSTSSIAENPLTCRAPVISYQKSEKRNRHPLLRHNHFHGVSQHSKIECS